MHWVGNGIIFVGYYNGLILVRVQCTKSVYFMLMNDFSLVKVIPYNFLSSGINRPFLFTIVVSELRMYKFKCYQCLEKPLPNEGSTKL